MAECMYTDCFRYKPGIDEEDCNCVDGRFTGTVDIYASTCDGCTDLTAHGKRRNAGAVIFVGLYKNILWDTQMHGLIQCISKPLEVVGILENSLPEERLLFQPLEITKLPENLETIFKSPKQPWRKQKKRTSYSQPAKCLRMKNKSR